MGVVENLMQSFNVDSGTYVYRPQLERNMLMIPIAHLSSRTRFFLVPRSINRYFIGRQNVLDVVKAHVAACTTDQGRQIRMAITGIAGIGKSEICLKLADMVRERSDFCDSCVAVNDANAQQQCRKCLLG